jgi:transmembrane sensor
MTDHDDIERIAADWLARRDSGALSPADEAAFVGWLNASVAHRVSYLRLNATWTRTQRLAALEHRDAFAYPFAATAARLRHAIRGAIAVTCLVLTCAVGWYGWHYSQSIYRTEIGAMQSLPLADGSRITLNTNSKLRVALSKGRREIDLHQGEAYFEVKHDGARPFLVHSGEVDVEVVGTQFAIHRSDESVRVLVNDGHVRVHAFVAASRKRYALEMVAGDIAVLAAGGIEHRHATPEELDAALSWRKGQIVFRDIPLAAAVAEFNRYRNKPLVIVDPQLAEMRIGGTFRTSNADGFLQLLQHGFDVDISTQEEAILLSRR